MMFIEVAMITLACYMFTLSNQPMSLCTANQEFGFFFLGDC